jgi:hypothetical protein
MFSGRNIALTPRKFCYGEGEEKYISRGKNPKDFDLSLHSTVSKLYLPQYQQYEITSARWPPPTRSDM